MSEATAATAPPHLADRASAALDAVDLPGGLRPSPHVRAAGDEHLVLLDLASSQYFMLNPTGAMVWRGLGEGLALEDVVARLADDVGTGDGQADRQAVRREATDLARYLLAEGLLRRADAEPRAPAPEDCGPGPAAFDAKAKDRRPPTVFAAWCAIAYVDLVASVFGIRRLLRLLPACPTEEPGSASRAAGVELDPTVAGTVAAVDRAASFYLRKAWCLARSAACTWLLRRRAVPARLVLGVRPLPFFAHAWVEVDGRVVNDADRVEQLAVLDRF